MQTVSFTFLRFDSLAGKAWVMPQMQFSKGPLRRTPDIGFFKLFGTGPRNAFHLSANLGVYAVMATWPSLAIAKARVNDSPAFNRLRARADETCTLYCATTRTVGDWDGGNPFRADASGTPDGPLGVLTRATLRPRHLLAFWKSVPDISKDIARYDSVLFKVGLGEVPGLQQVTFSVWENFSAVRAFAYADGFHSAAIAEAREKGWFSEELFARFQLLEQEGTWEGGDALPARVFAAGDDAAAARH